MVVALLLLLAAPADRPAANATAAAAPALFASESLLYTLNWPTGLSLGEGRMRATHDGGEWRFELGLDASLPGFEITDSFRSTAAGEFCSTEFVKQSVHGPRRASETTTYDSETGIATRETANGGGKSEMRFSGCARDALAYLYFLRHELAHGRIPAPQTVYFGAPYTVKVGYGGEQSIRVGDKPYTADRVIASFKGPASSSTFEMFFARDAARTLLLVRVPFSLGTFSMELAR
ncbi:MAG: DUF3108 domain-containing protein [bacterium]|jgi:hypothetical protein